MLDPEALDDTLAYITREMELGRGVYVHGNDGGCGKSGYGAGGLAAREQAGTRMVGRENYCRPLRPGYPGGTNHLWRGFRHPPDGNFWTVLSPVLLRRK